MPETWRSKARKMVIETAAEGGRSDACFMAEQSPKDGV
jgi:hypothetical protein